MATTKPVIATVYPYNKNLQVTTLGKTDISVYYSQYNIYADRNGRVVNPDALHNDPEHQH